MSWFPWPDAIKKRACRYLLQHYLGQFLEEKLKLDQLSLDLFNGKGMICNVLLDVYAINDKLKDFNIPFELSFGKINHITVSVPWATILNDNSQIEVSGVEMTFHPAYVMNGTHSGMTESLFNSLQNMTISMELAQQCFKEHKDKDTGNMFEGLELFSQMIETVLSKINITFTNIDFRFENLHNDMSLGTCLKVHCDVIKYFDESGASKGTGKAAEVNLEEHVKMVSLSIASKCLVVDTITVFLSQFDPTASPQSGKLESKLACVYGQQQLKLRLQRERQIIEPKMDVECYLGLCCVLLSPTQMSLLFEWARAFFTPSIETCDASSVLSVNQQKSNLRASDTREFFSLDEAMLSHTPTENITFKETKHGQFEGVDIGETDQFQSVCESPQKEGCDVFDKLKETFTTNTTLNSRPLAPDTISFHCDLKIRVLVVHLLHCDPQFADSDKSRGQQIHNFVDLTNFHFDFIANKADLLTSDVLQLPQVLSQSCDTFAHLRLVSGPVFIDLKESSNTIFANKSVFVGVGSLIVQECLSDCQSDILWFSHGKSDNQHVTISLNQVSSDESVDLSIEVNIPESKVEVDLSIIDRLSWIINALQELCSEQPNYHCGPDLQFPDALSQQAMFQDIIMDVCENRQNNVSVNISSTSSKVLLFFPIPDLRPNVNKDDLFQKNLRPDVLHVQMDDFKFFTRLQDTTSIYSTETVDFHVSINQFKILYSDNIKSTPLPLLIVTKRRDCTDQPSIHVKKSSRYYNCDYEMAKSNGVTDTKHGFDNQRHVKRDFSESSPTPFSKRRVIYNNEEVKRPGNTEEIQQFVEHSSQTSQVVLYLQLPSVAIILPTKDVFQSVYNRLCNDLVLWQPIMGLNGNPMSFGNAKNLLSFSKEEESDMFYTFESNKESPSVSEEEDESSITSSLSYNKTIGCRKSMLAVILNIGCGKIAINCTSSTGPDSKTNCLLLELARCQLCTVLKYHGNENLDYVSFNAKDICLHQKLASKMESLDSLLKDEKVSPPFQLVVAPSTNGNKEDMITIAVKIETESKQCLNQYLLSCLISQASIKHEFVPCGSSWYEQLLEFFDVTDIPILGYEVPSVVTETHFHIQNSAISYKPKYLIPPTLAVVTIQSLSLSSNIVAFSPHSVLQVVIDNMAVYLCNCTLDSDALFVPVLDVNVLEICLKLSKQQFFKHDKSETVKFQLPVVDLVVSNNEIHLQTCADSLAMLGRLITYMSLDGDIDHNNEPPTSLDASHMTSDIGNEVMSVSCESHYSDAVSDLMADAMQDVQETNYMNRARNDHKIPTSGKTDLHGTRSSFFSINKVGDTSKDDEFCVVADDELESYNADNESPSVEYLVDSPIIRTPKLNHFLPVLGKIDQLQSPEDFPVPMYKYTIKELSCKWSLFGGNDFCKKQALSSPTRQHLTFQDYYSKCKSRQHQSDRDYSKLLDIKLIKIRFRHEEYHPSESVSLRNVLIVPEFEICDRMESSQINKMLYGFHSESSPKQSHANMLIIKAINSFPETTDKDSECRLFVSLQPLRINIDQDTMDFLTNFFDALNKHSQEDLLTDSYNGYRHTVPHRSITEANPDASKIFFKEIIFSPGVPIRLDYNGKHVDIEQGTVTGLLKGLGQLHCSQLTLRKIVHRHGILGVDRMLNFVLNEWAEDIVKNQIPSILGGVGPLHSFVQFFQGVHDLIWFPVEQFKRDGRIIKGLQKGSTAFGTSTTTAALELTNRLVCLIQAAAETTFNVVSPASSAVKANSYSLQATSTKRKKQPVDLREGINNAMNLVHYGVTDTAVTLARVAQQEHSQKGLPGALGGVLRHIPPTLVRPIIIASEATSNVLSGMRNQIVPDAQREDELKWRSNESS